MSRSSGTGIYALRFNQDFGVFMVSSDDGLQFYETNPLTELAHFHWKDVGSVAHAEMLYRTSAHFCVGGGSRPRRPSNVAMLYDEQYEKVICNMTFKTPVKAVRMSKDMFAVVESDLIQVLSYPCPIKVLYGVRTRDNPKGLCELTSNVGAEKKIMVFLGPKVGSVQIVDLQNIEPTTSSAPATISAHESDLACIALNQSGTRLATASTHGSLIRVWDTTTRAQLVELRRGSDKATIYCMNFSQDSAFLCSSSDKGTVHIFAIKDTTLNKRMTNALRNIGVKYCESQWGLTNFALPVDCESICAFNGPNSVVAICSDGTYHKYSFSTDGTCNREEFDLFLNLCPHFYFD